MTFYILIILLLILSVFNVIKYKNNKNVLGIETQTTESEIEFWKAFNDRNPHYLPAFIEIGEIDKLKKIDPNFHSPQ